MKDKIVNTIKDIFYSIFFPILFLFLVVLVYKKLEFDNFLRLIQVLIWPCVLLVALFFFRKVFFYFFLSMEEFNFFGAKGMLKNVSVVIDERVKKIREQEQREENYKLEREAHQNELNEARSKGENTKAANDKLFVIADKLIEDNQNLNKQILERDEKLKRYEANESALKYRLEALRNIVHGSVSSITSFSPSASPSPSPSEEETEVNFSKD